MPTPKTPWIAVDFESFVTRVALWNSKTNSIENLTFYNAYGIDDKTDSPILLYDPSEPQDEKLRDALVFSPDDADLSQDARSYTSDESVNADEALRETFARIREYCEKTYFTEPPTICYLAYNELDARSEKIEKALKLSGFEEVVLYRKGMALARRWAIDHASYARSRIALVNVDRDATELYVLKQNPDGVQDATEHMSRRIVDLDATRPLERVFDDVLRTVGEKYGSEEREVFLSLTVPFLARLEEWRRRYATGDEDAGEERIVVSGKRLRAPTAIYEKRARELDSGIVAEVEEFVSEVCKKNGKERKDFVVLVAGEGASLHLVEKLKAKFPHVKLDRNSVGAAAGIVETLTRLPLPFPSATDYEKTYVETYRKAVDGDSRAYFPLAQIYMMGAGVSKLYEEAAYWLRRALDSARDEESSAEAAYNLSLLYERGYGVRRDEDEARRLLFAAASGGYTKAQTALGLSLLDESPLEAKVWLTDAADAGDRDAVKLLAKLGEEKKEEFKEQRNREVRRQIKSAEFLRRIELGATWVGSAVPFLLCGVNVFNEYKELGETARIPRAIGLGMLIVGAIAFFVGACFLLTSFSATRSRRNS